MKIDTDIEHIRSNHKDVISQLETKKRRTKGKDVPLDSFNFTYMVAEMIQGMSFDEMIAKASLGEKPAPETPEQVATRRSAASRVHIEAKHGRVRITSELLKECPSQVYDEYLRSAREQEAARLAHEALPQEEKDRRLNESIRELQGMGGFMMLQIPRKRK